MLQPDGLTLQLDKKLVLPPGRGTVIGQSTGPGAGPTTLEILECSHCDQQSRGRQPMTEEEMAIEIAQMRAEEDEYERRWQEIWSQTDTNPQKTDNP